MMSEGGKESILDGGLFDFEVALPDSLVTDVMEMKKIGNRRVRSRLVRELSVLIPCKDD